jgi:signal transduction histidine kinase
VAQSAALAAAISALSAAVATSALGGVLLSQAEDRRLIEAGRDLVFLLGTSSTRQEIAAIVQHEHEETQHAGIRFTVSEQNGAYVAGDASQQHMEADSCVTRGRDPVRVCSVTTEHGLIVTAAFAHTPHTLLFSLATLIALAFSGAVTWFWCRPMVRSAMAPFSRLRSRVAALDFDAGGKADLGAVEHVVEVDELRATIEHLLDQVGIALRQSQRFAANAAHELRTPLTAVRAELELLGERPSLPIDVATDLTSVQSKVGDLVVLVERLLVLATPTRILRDATEVVSLRDVIEDVTRGLPPDQVARVAVSESDGLVRGDPMLLSSMISNALLNGLKFGDSVRVDVTVVDGVASITVDDDGPGLDEGEWESVFEPFYRDAAALRRRQPGHGLGLALVRHIAESHGGWAAFKRREGTGARLEVRLPEMSD